jgi:hypothetical protein
LTKIDKTHYFFKYYEIIFNYYEIIIGGLNNMKKYLLSPLFSLILILILIPSKLYAIDITAGATTWYTWWDMTHEGKTQNIDPAFLYGPVLSVKFNDDFNLTFVFLYGNFNVKDGVLSFSVTPIQYSKIRRSDMDLALNYRLNDYLKVFAGLKTINFSFGPNSDHTGAGPGLGLSATFPMSESIFLLATLSGFYFSWGKQKEYNFKEYGMNSTLSLAYYIAQASTTVSLGGRFQYAKSVYDDGEKGIPTGDLKQKFYGITLTATYSFSI